MARREHGDADQGVLSSDALYDLHARLLRNPAARPARRTSSRARTYLGAAQVTTDGSGDARSTSRCRRDRGRRSRLRDRDRPRRQHLRVLAAAALLDLPRRPGRRGRDADQITGTRLRDRRDGHDRRPAGHATSPSSTPTQITATSPPLRGRHGQRRRRHEPRRARPARSKAGSRTSSTCRGQQFYAFVTTLVRTPSRPASAAGTTASTSPRCASRWRSSS